MGKGLAARSLTANAHILCTRSTFFNKALSGSWKEAQNRSVNLPDDQGHTFRRYLRILNRGLLPQLRPSKHVVYTEFKRLAKLYVLAEKLQDTDTKNTILVGIVQSRFRVRSNCYRYFPGPSEIRIIYEGTPPSSPARKLIVDMYAGSRAKAEKTLPDRRYPDEFLHNLVSALIVGSKKMKRRGIGRNLGNYLKHNTETLVWAGFASKVEA